MCISDQLQWLTKQSVWDDMFFELVQPSSLNYLFRLRPAKDFGLTLVSFYSANLYDVLCCLTVSNALLLNRIYDFIMFLSTLKGHLILVLLSLFTILVTVFFCTCNSFLINIWHVISCVNSNFSF